MVCGHHPGPFRQPHARASCSEQKYRRPSRERWRPHHTLARSRHMIDARLTFLPLILPLISQCGGRGSGGGGGQVPDLLGIRRAEVSAAQSSRAIFAWHLESACPQSALSGLGLAFVRDVLEGVVAIRNGETAVDHVRTNIHAVGSSRSPLAFRTLCPGPASRSAPFCP